LSEQRLQLGQKGERLAAQFLQEQGYMILQQNFRCQYGEIDIIASKENRLIFVEVKTRSTTRFGTPGEAVTSRKQQQVSRAALSYLSNNNSGNQDLRFDVIEVFLPERAKAQIEHIPDAFELAWGNG
jgi:putative endonuclease